MKLGFKQEPEDSGFSQLDNEETYAIVSNVYADFVHKFGGKKMYYLGKKDHPQYKKKVENIRAFILICTELGVTFEVYMKAQFETLQGWLRNRGMLYPTFPMLNSEKAVDRFLEWQEKHSRKFESKKEATKDEQMVYTDYHKSIFQSAERFKKRLEKFPQMDVISALMEFEMLARMGYVTNLYVYSHPMVLKSNNHYLKSIQIELKERLTEDQKQVLRDLRADLRGKYGEEGMSIYV